MTGREKERKRIKILKTYISRDGKKLKYREKFCVPSKSIPRVLELVHDTRLVEHFAFAKTLNRLQYFHRKHKRRDVRAYCDECQTCQQQKDSKGQTLHDQTPVELPERRWKLIVTNFIVDRPETVNGHNSTTTIVDQLSRRARFL